MLSRFGPVLVIVLAAACASGHRASSSSAGSVEQPQSPPRSARDPLEAARARAEAAISELARRFQARLFEELQSGGPTRALAVCREDVQLIVDQVAVEHRVEIGRTSLRLRNPRNAPRPWVTPLLFEADRVKPSDVVTRVVDLGDRIGVVRPIFVSAPCTQCHGTAKQIAEPVRGQLERLYPKDAAIGYAPGDLRGFYWVEAPK